MSKMASKFPQKNQDLRQLAKDKKVPMWAVADKLGIAESTLNYRLRKELTTEERSEILEAFEQLAKEVG